MEGWDLNFDEMSGPFENLPKSEKQPDKEEEHKDLPAPVPERTTENAIVRHLSQESQGALTTEQKTMVQNYMDQMKFGINGIAAITCKDEECPYFSKCIPWYAPIRMGDGRMKAIGKIRAGDIVTSIDKDGDTLVMARVVAVRSSGIKKVYRINLSRGYSFECTADHEILTKHDIKRYPDVRRWSSIKDGLRRNQHVAVAMRTLHNPVEHVSDDLAKLIGYHLSDGCYSSYQMSFSNTNLKYIHEYLSCATNLGSERAWIYTRHRDGRKTSYEVRVTSGHSRPDKVREIMRRHGLARVKGPDKRVPEIFYGASLESIALMINRFWSGDGNISKNHSCISALAENEDLLLDISSLLEKFGIRSKVVPSQGHYVIRITDRDSIRLFLDRIGHIYGKEQYCQDISERVGAMDSKLTRENDLGWLRVLSIEHVGEEECFDIQVSDTESFIAWDVVVHNCPLVKAKIPRPVGKDCPVELDLAQQWLEGFVRASGIQLEMLGAYDMLLLNDLAYQQVLEARAAMELSDNPQIQVKSFAGRDAKGNAVYTYTLNNLVTFREKSAKMKMKILQEMIATARAKSSDAANRMDRSSETAERLKRVNDLLGEQAIKPIEAEFEVKESGEE